MAVGGCVAVVERAGAGVAFVRVPVDAAETAGAGDGDQIVDEGAANTLAAGGGVDEKVFEIAVVGQRASWRSGGARRRIP